MAELGPDPVHGDRLPDGDAAQEPVDVLDIGYPQVAQCLRAVGCHGSKETQEFDEISFLLVAHCVLREVPPLRLLEEGGVNIVRGVEENPAHVDHPARDLDLVHPDPGAQVPHVPIEASP